MGQFWGKIQFWKKQEKKKMLEEGKDFRFLDFKDSDITGIELLIPEFKNVVYHYGSAKIIEEGDHARVVFGYTLVHPGELWDIDELNDNESFHTILGEVLNYILMTKAELDANSGNDDSQESNLFI